MNVLLDDFVIVSFYWQVDNGDFFLLLLLLLPSFVAFVAALPIVVRALLKLTMGPRDG